MGLVRILHNHLVSSSVDVRFVALMAVVLAHAIQAIKQVLVVIITMLVRLKLSLILACQKTLACDGQSILIMARYGEQTTHQVSQAPMIALLEHLLVLASCGIRPSVRYHSIGRML